MPVTTPEIKWQSVERLGATVVLVGDSYDEAQAYAKKRAKEESRTFIPPFDHPDIIMGQGTIGMEIVRQMQGPLHTIFVPVGGGGLIAGIAAYVKRVSPENTLAGFTKLSSTLSNLEMLDLKYNYLNDSILLSLSELSSLRYLDLSYNRIEGSSHSRGFQWISRLTKLETLVLSGNSLKNSVLLHMRNLSFLKNLRLSDNHLEGRVLHIQDCQT
ncbi:threonine dehydratase 1 biosynthetic, chloroplastic-like isoform X1 [Gossypium arboreum]|uniref:threonine dehydratase 1 biosynthetic, chloroplastic-like isoform X1 n=1 Tax=Gossypium arboreum TaxID=29729 RepID=UPI0022F1ACB3|nr:threonine dehydratase 1 biosynthetic, chloroplastic-like isoform X1 [Gossypium arboreum]XP_052880934.1 threonine dehydratase 1 biosynthetic, chloroplastic-like isoform X1 [Gossypium arboreum]